MIVTDAEWAWLQERHRPDHWYDGEAEHCATDSQPWPCPTRRLMDEVERLRAVREAAARLAALWTTDSIYADEQAALAALHAALDDDGSAG